MKTFFRLGGTANDTDLDSRVYFQWGSDGEWPARTTAVPSDMNCKPGDLAIVIKGHLLGKLVEVLYAPPPYIFRLPDDQRHAPGRPGDWVCKILGAPVNGSAWVNDWPANRLAQYGVFGDHGLRPIRGLPETEHHDEEITA